MTQNVKINTYILIDVNSNYVIHYKTEYSMKNIIITIIIFFLIMYERIHTHTHTHT